MTTGTCYIDTSVLVAALGNERHTEPAQKWLAAQPPGELLISDWVITEFSSAMALKLRTGQLQPEHRAECLAMFAQLVEHSLTVLPVSSANFRAAARFADQPHTGLRAGDALHLAICANHVTRKITRALARIHLGLQSCLYLGNLDARRDWGHARDYVEAQWLMLQQEQAEDFVIATGKQQAVRDFVNHAAAELNVEIDWQGQGAEERGVVARAPEESAMKPGQTIVAVDPKYFRPAEVDTLLGDPTKANQKLGWTPKTSFEQLVKEMMQADLEIAQRDTLVTKAGFRAPNHHE